MNTPINSHRMKNISLPYRRFDVKLDLASSESVSSFLGATLRGGFGYVLKKTVCAAGRQSCERCILRNQCAYAWLFETFPHADAVRLRKYKHVPHPFAMRPAQNGSRMLIELVLIGDAIRFLPYFIYTFDKLGATGLGKRRVRFSVQEAVADDQTVVYSARSPDAIAENAAPRTLTIKPGRKRLGTVTLNFISPVVIRRESKPLDRFDPVPFVTTLLRRVTNLNAFFGENKTIDIDPSPYIKAAESLACDSSMRPLPLRRFSTRQQQRIDYTGLVGTATLKGDVGTLTPLLKAGEILGVGKNTVFGFGRYVTSNNVSSL